MIAYSLTLIGFVFSILFTKVKEQVQLSKDLILCVHTYRRKRSIRCRFCGNVWEHSIIELTDALLRLLVQTSDTLSHYRFNER